MPAYKSFKNEAILWKIITISIYQYSIAHIVESSCTLPVSFSAEFTNGTPGLRTQQCTKKISFKSQLFTLYISVTTISYRSRVLIGAFAQKCPLELEYEFRNPNPISQSICTHFSSLSGLELKKDQVQITDLKKAGSKKQGNC